MNKLTLTLISAVAAGIVTPALLNARGSHAPDRESKGAQSTESIMKRYPLLDRTITAEKSSNLLSAVSTLPNQRLNAPQTRGAAPVQMLGNVVYANDWDSRYTGYGIYEFLIGTQIDADLKLKGDKTAPNSNAGGVLVGNKFFSTYWYEGWGMIMLDLSVYDIASWEKIGTYYLEPDEGEIGYIASDMAYNPVSETIYGCFYNSNGNGYELATIEYYQTANEYYGTDYYEASKTTIGAVSNKIIALGVTSDDRLYGIMEDGCFYEFDSKTAEASLIGDTGIKVASSEGIYPQSGAVDQHDGKFYWASVDMNGNSVLYTVDPNDAHVEKVAEFPHQERVYGLTCLPHAADEGAPNYLSDFQVDFKDADLTGTVSFTLPTDNYDGSQGESPLRWHILANSLEVTSGSGNPGEAIAAEIKVEGGQTLIEAYAENSTGKSPYSSIDIWTGEDYPVMRKAEFSFVNNLATVTWAIEPVGSHGGHVANVTYDVVRMPSETMVAQGIDNTSLTETLTNNMPLGSYYYVITPTNKGLTGSPMETEKIIIGQSIIPPYLETFDSPASLELYTIIGKDWSWNTRTSNSDNGVVNCQNGGSWDDEDDEEFARAYAADGKERSNSWLITPEIKVEAGKTYDIHLKSWAVFGDKFEIWYGPGLDPSKYSILMPATEGFSDSSYSEEHTVKLTADKTESIHLGFVHAGSFDSFLRLDDLSISTGTGASSPAAITDLEVIPAPKGAKKATIRFTAPDKDQEGNALNKIDNIDILVGNDVVKTFANPAPGAELSYTYIAPDNGYYQFRIHTYNDGSMAPSTEKKVFIGVDVPKAPAAWIVDKGNYIEVQWELDQTGENDEYIDPDGVYYALFQTGADGYVDIDHPVAEGLQGTSCAFDFNPNEGEQGLLQLIICAYSEAGVSVMRYTSALLVGEPYQLPFTDGFSEERGYPWISNSLSDCFGLSTSHFSDGDGYSWGWGILDDDHTASIESGKISCDGSDKLNISFDYITNGGNEIKVFALYPDGSEKLVGTANEESNGSNDDWKSTIFEIPGCDGNRYIRLRFTFYNNAGYGHFMHLDNIHVDKHINHDISVEAALMKGQAKVGETAVIAATARNLGMNEAKDVKLNLYVNGALVDTKNINSIEPLCFETAYFNHLLTPSHTGNVHFTIESVYAQDEREENNEADIILNVAEATAPAPTNLTGTETTEGVILSWEAPEEFQIETIVEDFESYEPFSIDEIGDWTLVDADGRTTMTLAGLSYPNNGAKMAFMVFNPSQVILPDETVGLPESNTEAIAYDGKQYLISVATILDKQDDHNDDWLISPELSGNAQTVSFFAKQMINYYGPESCEVLYATSNTTDIADFHLLESFEIDNPVAWVEFTAQLPEGAKRFAIRVTTARGHVFMLDHITYERGTTRIVTGYNIYRDDKAIDSVGHNLTTYTDTDGADSHKYAVTALFANGEESGYSNIFVSTSGVEYIDAEETYDVMSVDGLIIQRRGGELKDLPKGVYIINGRKTMIK